MAVSLKNLTDKIAVVVLAAGSSSRMGEPKQMLKVGDDFLLRRSVKIALEAKEKVIVVLGHRADELKKMMTDLPVTILVNDYWEKGMGSSIKCGISFLKNNSFSVGLITTCDQPLLQADHLRKIIDSYKKDSPDIVASHYGGSFGIPALFDKNLFNQLLLIDDQQGAKKVIQENSQRLISIEFPEGTIDLDTPEDYRSYQRLIDKNKNL